MEFRRLCDLLRAHLLTVAKYAGQTSFAINLNSAESLQLLLETRFEQLNVAAHLELWQEAFKSVESIHGLVQMARKAPKSGMTVNYYEKLAVCFYICL